MNITTIAIYFVAAVIAFALLKFIIKLPFMIMTVAILGALGYAVYMYVWPMLQGVME